MKQRSAIAAVNVLSRAGFNVRVENRIGDWAVEDRDTEFFYATEDEMPEPWRATLLAARHTVKVEEL